MSDFSVLGLLKELLAVPSPSGWETGMALLVSK